ncbi:MAG: hypothetical protein IT435_15065 [Phycisphaerales bacterium]|nr:hypothetical protein [Phycisphaerales bacterium]
MHDEKAEGNAFFKCDYCLRPWAEELPMVEGHRGSLICAECLTEAYTQVVHAGAKAVPAEKETCAMCLEVRKDAQWRSTRGTSSLVCLRCIKQSARMLEKDPECGWKRPEGGSATAADIAGADDED